MTEKIETYRFDVEAFHVDFTGHLFLGVLGNHLLNAAGRHSHNRGWGIDHLNASHYTWVLSRLGIELDAMPAQYAHVEVETWVESVMKLFTERDFLIRDADNGRIYGYARSVWAMIDTTSRHPANLLALHDGDILRYVLSPDEKPCPIAKHSAIRVSATEPLRTLSTRYSDVDINCHINSIKYMEHIMDLFGREQYETRRLRRFDIAYKAESHLGDVLSFYVDGDVCGPEQQVEVRKCAGGVAAGGGDTAVLARVLWE
jgi:acyl-ACP thioesterase